MTHSTAEMAKKQSNKADAVQPDSGENAFSGSLDRRYRQIGISAVAAAVRYQGVAKNPAYAPVQTNWQHFAEDAAA